LEDAPLRRIGRPRIRCIQQTRQAAGPAPVGPADESGSGKRWTGKEFTGTVVVKPALIRLETCDNRGADVEVELALAQPLKEELVQPVGRVQWNPMAGVVDLLVAPGSFHEAS
jgi:hypothetical protein